MSIKVVNFLPWSLLVIVFISQTVDLMLIVRKSSSPTLAPATTSERSSDDEMMFRPSDDKIMFVWTTVLNFAAREEELNKLLRWLDGSKLRSSLIRLFPSKIESFMPEGFTEWDDEEYTHLLLINVGRIIKSLPEINIRILKSALKTIDGVLKRINNDAKMVGKIMNAFVNILFAEHPDDGRNLQLINYLIKSCKHRDAILEVAALIVKKKPRLTVTIPNLCSIYFCFNGIPMIVKTLIQFILETKINSATKNTLSNALFHERKLAQIEGLHKRSYYSAAAVENESLEVKILILFEFFQENGQAIFSPEIRNIINQKFAADANQCELIAVGEIGQLMDDESILTFVEFIWLMKRLVNIFQDDQVIQCLIENKLMELFGIDNLSFFKCAMNDLSVYSVFMISLLKLEPSENRLFEMVRTPIFPPGLETRRSFKMGAFKPVTARKNTSPSTTIPGDTQRRSLDWWESSHRNGGLPSTISGLPLSDEPDSIRRSCLPDLLSLSPSVTESSLLERRPSRDSLRKIKDLIVPMPISRRQSRNERSLSTDTPPPTGTEIRDSVPSTPKSPRNRFFSIKQNRDFLIKLRVWNLFRRNSSSDMRKFQKEEETTSDPRKNRNRKTI